MKNAGPYIREQLFTLLEGSVPYANNPVPVYETGNAESGLAYYIEIADQSGFNDNDKARFQSTYTQTLEVVSESETWTRRHVDAIAGILMQLLKPTLYTCGLPDSSVWQITNLTITPPRYLRDESASGTKIMRLLLELRFTITEKPI